MPLFIKPLFGDLIVAPFSPPMSSWREVYTYLCTHYFHDVRLDQLRLYHNESTDLSNVKDGDVLHLFTDERMAERWVYERSTDMNDGIRYHHSTLTWYDIRWGDPYENPSVMNRSSLTFRILTREQDGTRAFMINPVYYHEEYTTHDKSLGIWYSTLREACYAFHKKLNDTEGEEAVTEKTVEHFIHLWELYHGTHPNLVDHGRYHVY